MLEQIQSKGIEELSKNVDKSDEAIELIKKIEKAIKKRKNNILMPAYHQGIIFRRFKEDIKFTNAVSKFNISKTTINFKIGIVKFVVHFPKMRTSSLSLFYLKNNFRIIEDVCEEHASQFQ